MSLRLIRAIANSENSDELHLSRILFLLNASSKKGTKTVAGITKLAKIDFLLRYPNCLERALEYLSKDTQAANIQEFERTTIESRMVRFRYGPWDERYRRWIGLLIAKGLANTFVRGRTIHVEITDKGKQVVYELANVSEFGILNLRSEIIIKAVGGFSATKIMNFIYDVFPELSDMKWGEEISI
jgi:hypothetical protein